MKQRIGLCCVLLVIFGLPLAARTGEGAPGDISAIEITRAIDTVVLQVHEALDLEAVLTTVCQEIPAECEIDPAARNVVIPPLVFGGSWTNIVSKLVEGTKLNYALRLPSSEGMGVVIVEERGNERNPLPVFAQSPASPAEAAESTSATASGAVKPSLTDKEIRQLRADQGRQPPAERNPMQGPANPTSLPEAAGMRPIPPASRNPMQGPSNPTSLSEALGARGAPSEPVKVDPAKIQRQEAATWNLILGVTPNPSSVPPGMVALPVGDANGNLILLPKTDQKLHALPFPGPDGKLIQVLPGTSGQINPNPVPE